MTTTPDTERRERWEDAMAGPIANPRLIRSAATEGMHMADLEAAEARAAALDDHERQFLTFALDLAADRVLSEDGFTDEDDAALASLRRMAAAARPDNTGAPASCWCGHPEHRHYTGNTRMTFPNGCHDCPGWDGAHAYGQELPWRPETDDTTGA